MTPEILDALLQAWPAPDAVRVCGIEGEIVSQNAAASQHSDDADFWQHESVRHHALSAEWQLQARLLTAGETDKAPDKAVEIEALSRGITHELRNPLSAILTAITLVHDDAAASEETKMLLGVMRKESQRMNRILTDFSAYVKPRAPQPAVFDATQTVHQVVHELSRNELWSHDKIHIEINGALQQTLLAHADEEHFRDVLRHVMHNAIEAMPHGGHLRLDGAEVGNKVFFIVLDSGGGFSPEGLERAFHPFFSSKAQSTGLGLSIARSAVEASGGHIFIDNFEVSAEDKTKASTTSSNKSASVSPEQNALPTTGGHSGARVRIELPSVADKHRRA